MLEYQGAPRRSPIWYLAPIVGAPILGLMVWLLLLVNARFGKAAACALPGVLMAFVTWVLYRIETRRERDFVEVFGVVDEAEPWTGVVHIVFTDPDTSRKHRFELHSCGMEDYQIGDPVEVTYERGKPEQAGDSTPDGGAGGAGCLTVLTFILGGLAWWLL